MMRRILSFLIPSIFFLLVINLLCYSSELDDLYKKYKSDKNSYSDRIRLFEELVRLGKLNLENGQFNKAYNYFMEAEKLDNENIELLKYIAELYGKTGYYKLSSKYWIKYSKLISPENKDFYKAADIIIEYAGLEDKHILEFKKTDIFVVNRESPPLKTGQIKKYRSSHPLGEDLTPAESGEGPFGAITVPSPGASGKNTHAVGTGILFSKQDSLSVTDFIFAYSYGLTDNTDISAAVPVSYSKNSSSIWGLKDTYLGVKYTFNTKTPALSLSFNIRPPIGKKTLTDPYDEGNGTDLIFDLPAELDYGAFLLNGNIGVNFDNIGKNSYTSMHTGFSISRTLTETLSGSLDILLDNITRQNEIKSFGFIGLKWNFVSNLSSNFSLGTQFNSDGADLILTTSFSFLL